MSTRRPRPSEGGPYAWLPPCPAHLQGEARREWRRIGRRLADYGLMTEIDTAALAAYCTSWARWVEAEQALARFGTVIKSPSGYPMQSPYLAIANKAMDQMAKLLVEFGMSPSSRTRVTRAKAAPASDEGYPVPAEADEVDPRRLLRAVND